MNTRQSGDMTTRLDVFDMWSRQTRCRVLCTKVLLAEAFTCICHTLLHRASSFSETQALSSTMFPIYVGELQMDVNNILCFPEMFLILCWLVVWFAHQNSSVNRRGPRKSKASAHCISKYMWLHNQYLHWNISLKHHFSLETIPIPSNPNFRDFLTPKRFKQLAQRFVD